MELTEGILKAIDSAVMMDGEKVYYIVRYKGRIMNGDGDNVRVFLNEGAAKAFITRFIRGIFWHGSYWQSCSRQIKARTGYDVDFSGTMKLIKSYDKIIEKPESKKIIKNLVQELLNQNIFTIEKFL